MRKVGIITLYKDNFGSILQAYSTCRYVESIGFESSIIQVDYKEPWCRRILKVPSVIYRCIRYPEYLHDRLYSKKKFRAEESLLSSKTKEMMITFIENNFRIVLCNYKNIKTIEKEYDYFIVGSDQIWNGYSPYSFLKFTSKKKRVSLAPSFGTASIKEYHRKNVRKGLLGFNRLSVREETGLLIVKELANLDAVRLPDPTELFDKSFWQRFASNGIQRKNYVLLHFLNRPSELALNTINEYLKKNKVYALCIANNYSDYNRIINSKFIDVTPYDYVSLINNTDFVFTDSFHTTLFSIRLEKEFLVFDRQHIHGNSQRSRIVDLLRRVSLLDRFVEIPVSFNNLTPLSHGLFDEDRQNIRIYLRKELE